MGEITWPEIWEKRGKNWERRKRETGNTVKPCHTCMSTPLTSWGGGGVGVGYSDMKGTGILVISFRGVNYSFWYHLG